MRWNRIDLFNDGDTITVSRFAWVPTYMDDMSLVWLEWYKETRVFRSGFRGDIGGEWYPGVWRIRRRYVE